MDDLSLRDYHPGDWEAMYALDLLCFDEPFRFSRRAMRRFAEASNAIAMLADAAHHDAPLQDAPANLADAVPQEMPLSDAPTSLAGFAIAHLEARVAYIVTLDVAPGFRRRGLARRLMAELEARARAAGATAMALHVFTGNTAAIRFYESLGYNRTGLAEHFYARGIHALTYRKILG